jgi:hypothetical protein
MKPESEPRVKAVFHTALSLPPTQRAAFLEQACGADSSLRAEVESLLAASDGRQPLLATLALPIAPPSDPRRVAPGQMIGRYRVLSLLGSGGMGEIYLAEDPRLGRRIALKILPRELSHDPDRLQRLEREARAASRLAHPNVCVIHEIADTDDERRFIAMEYVEGESLRAVLERHRAAGTRMVPAEAIDVVLQVAAGLASCTRPRISPSLHGGPASVERMRHLGALAMPINAFPVEPKYELIPHEFAKNDPAFHEFDDDEVNAVEGRGFVVQRICDAKRLSWHTLPKREGLESLLVAGVSHRQAQLQDPSFTPGQLLELVPESTNPYDPNAIGVWNRTRTLQIGYVPKDKAATLAKKLASQEEVLGCLSLWEYRAKGQRVALRILLLGERARVRGP